MVKNGAFSPKTDYINLFFGDSLSGKTSKLHHWFESYVDFGELVDFYYLKLVGGGAVINKAYPV